MELSTPIKTDNPIPLGHFCLLRWPTLFYGVCFSLNKSTSCLSLYLSLNSFCDEMLRTWFINSSDWAWPWWKDCRFKSQSKLHGLRIFTGTPPNYPRVTMGKQKFIFFVNNGAPEVMSLWPPYLSTPQWSQHDEMQIMYPWSQCFPLGQKEGD